MVDQSQQSRPANQSEQTGLWFQTEGGKRCCSTGSMRKIKSFLNIKARKHGTVNTDMNMKISIICPQVEATGLLNKMTNWLLLMTDCTDYSLT